MSKLQRMTAIIEREDDGYVALCPELDIASQGSTIEEARTNLIEALTLFFEVAEPSEISRRLHSDVFIPRILGVLLAIAGLCYLTNSFANFLSPAFAANLVPYI